jgi:3-phenylpropionate/trans-cinnamate dioxygenase ferredoxin reductase subunit
MSAERTFVIIGGSLAGGRAAETLRTEGFDGPIKVICAEAVRPYKRPPLSKEYLRREKGVDAVFLRPLEWYERERIEFLLDRRIARVDAKNKRLHTHTGETIDYDTALITTGAVPRRVDLPGSTLGGIHYLRTLQDSDSLAGELTKRPRVLVLGGGFIGCEVAASARTLGCEVTMVSRGLPLVQAIGSTLGEAYARIHRDRGVELLVGAEIEQFRGDERVEEAITTAGKKISCDVVVIGVGVVPATELVDGEAVEVDNGIITDEFCRTSVPDLYAAGDVANWWHPRLQRRVRVEHFDNAHNQGIAAAKSMLGKGEAYAPIPYFWSDQYDVNLQYVGLATASDRVIVRGDAKGLSFSGFFMGDDGKLSACVAVNRFRDITAARRLLRAGVTVTDAQLADETFDLKLLEPSVAP